MNLSKSVLRDYLIRVHGLSSGCYMQSPEEMLKRIHRLATEAINRDTPMLAFLGYVTDRSDALSGASLEDAEEELLEKL
jgi:hypothetical protein